MSELQRDECQEVGEDCLIWGFITCKLQKILLGWSIYGRRDRQDM